MRLYFPNEMNFVTNPNLPGDVKIVLIGEEYAQNLEIPLKNMGVIPIFVPNNPCVDNRIKGHADISVLHLGKNKLMLAPYLKGSGLDKKLSEIGMEIEYADIIQNPFYPNDAALNLCICGTKLIYNPKSVPSSIVDYLTIEEGLEKLIVKQGYTKCSVCVVREDAIITSDEVIHKRAVEAGINSLKICEGYIELPGYDYGFIGGAAFKLSHDTLAFTGNLNNHPDKNNILNFLSLHNINTVYITEFPAFDIGSVIQIVEK